MEIPKEVKARQVFDLEITQKQMDDVITTFLADFAPKALEIITKQQYSKVTGITKEQADQMKKDLPILTEEWDKYKEEALAELNKGFKNFFVKLSNVVDNRGYIAHSIVNIGFIMVGGSQNPGEVTFTLTGQFTNYNINGKQTFKNKMPPNAKDILPMQDLDSGFPGSSL